MMFFLLLFVPEMSLTLSVSLLLPPPQALLVPPLPGPRRGLRRLRAQVPLRDGRPLGRHAVRAARRCQREMLPDRLETERRHHR